MEQMSLLIPAVTVAAALSGFEQIGLDTASMIAAVRLDPQQLRHPDGVVADEVFGRLWALAFAQRPQPDLPAQAASATPFGAFGPLDHLVASAHSVGEGLHTLRLFFRLVSATVQLRFDHTAGDWVWLINEPSGPADAISDQWTLALIVQRLRAVVEDFRVQEVWLTQNAALPAEVFQTHFDAPVRLGQARSGLHLGAGVWRAAINSANPALHGTLRALAERIEIQQFAADPLGYAIRARLPEALRRGQHDAAAIAAHLGMPLRTLQRRLADENVTFSELLDAARKEEALRLLQHRSMPLADVAYMLGYNEQSSFNRAFRRWTSMSPRAWLAQTMSATRAGSES
jgi:AraC-like DNA-binding protein